MQERICCWSLASFLRSASLSESRPPVVHTLHGPWTEPSRRLYGLLDDYINLVAISESQRADNPEVRYAGVVHNGIDLASYPFRDQKDEGHRSSEPVLS